MMKTHNVTTKWTNSNKNTTLDMKIPTQRLSHHTLETRPILAKKLYVEKTMAGKKPGNALNREKMKIRKRGSKN